MPKGILLNRDGKRIGDTDLPDTAFGVVPNEAVVHQYLDVYRANQRQGTHSTLGISEVSGGGRKPWRQKGTGRARVGTIRSPLWRHGGITFGPKPRNYRKSFPKKMRRLALASVLSARAKDEAIYVLEDIDITSHKTAAFKKLLSEAGVTGSKVLLVTTSPEPNLVRAGQNLPGVEVTFTGELNTYQALAADNILFTKSALQKVEELCSR